MKIIDYYDKDSFDRLMCDDKNVILMMEDFFKTVPSDYRKTYDNNINDLTVLKVDRIKTIDKEYNNSTTGLYQQITNTILFIENDSVVHEFVHMSGFDSERFLCPFMDVYEGDSFYEGMTEYLAKIICQRDDVFGYYLESFIVEMLVMVKPELIKQAFIYDKNEFLSLFNNKFLLYSLLSELSNFGNTFDNEKITLRDRIYIKKNIRNIMKCFNNLLNEEDDKQAIKNCKDAFLDIVDHREVGYMLSDYDRNYKNYIYREFMMPTEENSQNKGVVKRLIRR